MKSAYFATLERLEALEAEELSPVIDRPQLKLVTLLTPRQQEELDFSSRGLTVAASANEQSYSHSTVKYHRKNIFKRLEARNMSHAVRIGYALGLLATELTITEPPQQLNPKLLIDLESASQGLTVVESADSRGVKPSVVKFNRGLLMQKLHAITLPHAVRIGLQTGILHVEQSEI